MSLRRNKNRRQNRCVTAVMLDNDIRDQIGATDRYFGHSHPQVDTTGTDRIRTFAIADIMMIRYLLFGRRSSG